MTYALPSQAAAAAQDGDQILISGSGNYIGDVAHWTQNNLTIEGVNGRPVLDASGKSTNGQALWLFSGSNLVIKNLEFKNCTQGSGILINSQAAGSVLVQSCYIHDNQTGLLVGDNAASDVALTNCEFNQNGSTTNLAHNVDVRQVRSLNMQGCWSHNAVLGDDLSSKASINYILYNRIGDDNAASQTACEIALPNGGSSFIIGNSIYKNSGSSNSQSVEYIVPGNALNASQNLYVINNTFATAAKHAIFLTANASPNVVLKDNLFLGSGTILNSKSPKVSESNNLSATSSWFTNAAAYDFHLASKSPAIGAGTPQGSSAGISLAPVYQFWLDSTGRPGVIARASRDVLDTGAYGASATLPITQNKVTTQSVTSARPTATVSSATTAASAAGKTSGSSPSATAAHTAATPTTASIGSTTTAAQPATATDFSPIPASDGNPAPANKLPRLGFFCNGQEYGKQYVAQDHNYDATYDAFSKAMGEQPLCFDTYVDWTCPWVPTTVNGQYKDGFVGNSESAAYTASQDPRTKKMIPVVGIPLASTFSTGWSNTNTKQFTDIANGDHDAVFRGIVDTWSHSGFPVVYYRLGWEMNFNNWPWFVGTNTTQATAWVNAFRRMSKIIRAEAAVKNQTAYIVWNPMVINYDKIPVPDVYPGDDYVDVLGLDLYNTCWPVTYKDVTTGKMLASQTDWIQSAANREAFWNGLAGGTGVWGMSQHIAFAKNRNQTGTVAPKPIALCESGSGKQPGNDAGLYNEGVFPVWLGQQISLAAQQGIPCPFVNIWDTNVGDGTWQFTGNLQPVTQAAWVSAFGINSPDRQPVLSSAGGGNAGKGGTTGHGGTPRAGLNSGKGLSGHGLNTGKGLSGHSLNTGKGLSGHSLNTGKGLSGHSLNTGKALSGHGLNSGKGLSGHGLNTGKALSGHPLNTGKALSGHPLNTGKALSGHPLNTGKALSSHPLNTGKALSGHGPSGYLRPESELSPQSLTGHNYERIYPR